MSESKAKTLFFEFAESTTCHGIRNVFGGGSKLRRFIWLVCVLGSTVYLVLNCTSLIKSYINKETVTRVTIQHQDSVMFPAVTICNFNPIRLSYLEQINITNAEDIDQLLRNGTFDENSVNVKAVASGDDFFLQAGHQIKNMLLNCTLQGEKCSPDDFERILTSMGACYTLNIGNCLHIIVITTLIRN